MSGVDELRVGTSKAMIFFYRSFTGFLDGMFDAGNSTQCSSRLTQIDENYQHLITTQYLDTFLYKLASIISASGYAVYHCYYMGDESYGSMAKRYTSFMDLSRESDVSLQEFIFYNWLWD